MPRRPSLSPSLTDTASCLSPFQSCRRSSARCQPPRATFHTCSTRRRFFPDESDRHCYGRCCPPSLGLCVVASLRIAVLRCVRFYGVAALRLIVRLLMSHTVVVVRLRAVVLIVGDVVAAVMIPVVYGLLFPGVTILLPSAVVFPGVWVASSSFLLSFSGGRRVL